MTEYRLSNPSDPPTKARIIQELRQFATPDDKKGLTLFCVDMGLYVAGLALVLFGADLAWKIAGSVIAGFKLASFITLGHDAAHRMLVKNRTLNKCLAYACFIPIFHNYRMWIWDHHEIHHQKTNGGHFDSFTPYSKAEFDRLPLRKQLFERFIRSPNLIGFGVHYLFQRMPRVRILPNRMTPQRYRRGAWRDFAVLVAYQCIFLGFLYVSPQFAPVTSGTALLLGFVVPMCLFATLVGGSLYLMHTNRNVPWFRGDLDRRGDAAAEYCSTNLTLPYVLSKLVHHVFMHSVHHAHPGVPCYYTPEAQRHLDAMLGDRAVREPMSVSGAIATLRACKLYDFDNHQWLDFDGKPTTGRLNLGRREHDLAA